LKGGRKKWQNLLEKKSEKIKTCKNQKEPGKGRGVFRLPCRTAQATGSIADPIEEGTLGLNVY